MKNLFIASILFSCIQIGFSQDYNYPNVNTHERKAFSSKMNFKASPETDNYDIIYHRILWEVDPAVYQIKGEVCSYFKATESSLNSIYFDIIDALTIESVIQNGVNLTFTHTNNLVQITLPNALNLGQIDSLTIKYSGVPQALTGFGSFVTNEHEGTPILWTLSEPYGAREWWPCKQSLSDKIDSIDIYIKAPAIYKAASNGKLISEITTGTKKITHWKHRHPIAAYLVAMAVTNYETYSHFAQVNDSQRVEIINYVYPENLNSAKISTEFTVKVMELYSDLFIPYPFHNEKYGHAQFGWGGGMEHQTIGFMGGFSESLITHELAHQWFGDHVTCKSWQDIWVNEGFAVFCENLAQEHLYPENWVTWKAGRMDIVISDTKSGSIFVEDTANVNRIFNSALTYQKGGLILQMLRSQLGDVAFFNGINELLTNPKTSGKFASGLDVQHYFEEAGDTSLTSFFNDWYYGQGYPQYKINWEQDENFLVHVLISQTTTHTSVPFFKLKVPLLFKNNSQEILSTFMNTENEQAFTFNPGFVINEVIFDPNYDIIAPHPADIRLSVEDETFENSISIFPNPTKHQLTITAIQGVFIEKYDIIDASGKQIRNSQTKNSNRVDIDITDFNLGVFYIRIKTNQSIVVKTFVKTD
jgi:aminopeptidase N